MPYINQERRIDMDIINHAMWDANIVADGDLNYLLFRYCKLCVKPSYNNYKNYIGELRQCATEIERRLLAPYEDLKLKENGEVQ